MRYDTTELIAQIKRVESIPSSQSLFSNTDFVQLANQELHTTIVPLIQSTVEEYFVHSEDFTVTNSSPSITIPPEATGLRLREIYYLDQEGGNIIGNARRINIEAIGGDYGNFGWNGYQYNGFYVENNKVKFYPQIVSTRYVRLLFYKAPNNLVLTTQGGNVTVVDSMTNTITVPNIPSTWAVGTVLDILESAVPFNTRKANVTITGLSGFDITLSASDFANITVGDYVYLAGEASVPQYIPTEAFYLLVQATAIRCLQALSDQQGLQAAWAKFNEMKINFVNLISPRIVGETKRVVNTNSIFNATRIRRYRRNY